MIVKRHNKIPNNKLFILHRLLVIFFIAAGCAHSFGEISTSSLSKARCDKNIIQSVHEKHCYTIDMLENPNSQDGSRINVNVLQVRALKQQGHSPLFIIAGGPGQAATQLASQLTWIFRKILQNRDLVFIDQRGTGKSHPLNCNISEQDLGLSTSKQQALFLQELRVCIDELDADFEYYTTKIAVSDLETARKKLGYDKINLWGASYGTRVVLEYMRLFPRAIDSTILDGVAPYENRIPFFLTQDSSYSLQKIFEECELQSACKNTFPELKNNWLNLLNTLKHKPLLISLSHPRTQKEDNVYIDDVIISTWLRTALYARELAPIIPYSIAQAVNGNYEPLYGLGSLAENLNENISLGMQLAVLCMEGYTDTIITPDYNHLLSVHPLFDNKDLTPLFNFNERTQMQQICNMFPKIERDTLFQPIKSDIPTLILSGTFDPATPPYWANVIAKHLTQSKHIVVTGAHHGVSSLPCIPGLIDLFLRQKHDQEIDLSCVDSIRPLAYFIDGAGPAMQLLEEHTTND